MLEIAYAAPSERQVVADFMHAAFPRAKWPMAGWQAITSGRWGAAAGSRTPVCVGGGGESRGRDFGRAGWVEMEWNLIS
jgi:hypothetical protein